MKICTVCEINKEDTKFKGGNVICNQCKRRTKWSGTKKRTQLGQTRKAARKVLNKKFLFALAVASSNDTCPLCSLAITDVADAAIDHATEWVDHADPTGTYFDTTTNVRLVHKACKKTKRKDANIGHVVYRPSTNKYRAVVERDYIKIESVDYVTEAEAIAHLNNYVPV